MHCQKPGSTAGAPERGAAPLCALGKRMWSYGSCPLRVRRCLQAHDSVATALELVFAAHQSHSPLPGAPTLALRPEQALP